MPSALSFRLFLFTALGLMWAFPAFAHPHVFIDYQVNFRYSEQLLEGFDMRWRLDAMNSRLILDEFDKNKDGQLTSTEENEAAQNLRDNLRLFDYFTKVKLNGHSIPVKRVTNIRVRQQGGRIVYSLFLSCRVPLSKKIRKLNVRPWDKSNFVAFKPQANAVRFSGPQGPIFRVVKAPKRIYDSLTVSFIKL